MDSLQTIVGERRTYTSVGCSHDHPFAQLIVPLTGTLFIETQVYQLELNESSVFFLPPGCSHYFHANNPNEFLVLDIPAHLVTGWVHGNTSYGIRAEFEERWRAIRTLLLAELEGQLFPSSASCMPQTDSLLHLVHYIRSLLKKPYSSLSLQYIHQNYHTSLEIARLAQIEGYSLSYYSEWFKTQTGKSPKAYIQDLRLQRAKELLQWTDWPICQIAMQVGFEQASSLTRLFQRHEATTPYRYRADIRNSANLSL